MSFWQTVSSLFIAPSFISQTRFSFFPGSLLNSFSCTFFFLKNFPLKFLKGQYSCNNRKKALCYVFPHTFFQLDPIGKDKITDCARCLTLPVSFYTSNEHKLQLVKATHLSRLIALFLLIHNWLQKYKTISNASFFKSMKYPTYYCVSNFRLTLLAIPCVYVCVYNREI